MLRDEKFVFFLYDTGRLLHGFAFKTMLEIELHAEVAAQSLIVSDEWPGSGILNAS